MRTRIPLVLALLISAAAVVSAGQIAGTLSGPALGHVFATDRTIRPILGIPGSSRIAAALETGTAIENAEILAGNRYAIAATDGPEALLLDLAAAPVVSRPIRGAGAHPDGIASSPRGNAAALYYPGARTVSIVTGIPDDPAGTRSVDMSTGPLRRMAIADGGAALLVAVGEELHDGEHDMVYSWTPARGIRFVAAAERITGMAFSGADAFFSDAGTNEVYRIGDVAGAGSVSLVAGSKEKIAGPVGIAVSERSEIYVANAGNKSVVVLDASGRVLRTVTCDCQVTGIRPLRDSIFWLTERVDEALYLMDSTTSEERIFFVPALR